jgi:processive 1,2-diacylglycerol beta-glucosyltransferase
MPGFTRNLQRDQCSRRWALDPRRVTVLMMGGGSGIGMSPSLIRSILAIDESLQIIVMTGKNQSLFQELNSLACFCQGRLVPLAFTDEVPDLMACADLVITKPGGLSTSECLAMGLPMLLINPIPGQEERNAALLLQEGVAQRADDEATLIYRLRRLLSDAETLSVMRSKTRLLAQPHAAQQILQHVRARLPVTMF